MFRILIVIILSLCSNSTMAQPPVNQLLIQQRFESFWSLFRDSVRAGDYSTLATQLCHETLISKDPEFFEAILLSRENATPLIPAFLSLDTHKTSSGMTHAALVSQTEKLKPLTENYARLHSFVFQFKQRNWCWSQILADPSLFVTDINN